MSTFVYLQERCFSLLQGLQDFGGAVLGLLSESIEIDLTSLGLGVVNVSLLDFLVALFVSTLLIRLTKQLLSAVAGRDE